MSQIKSLRTGIKFKDTPIGKIPVDWEAGPFSAIAAINPKRNLKNGNIYPFVEMAAISSGSHRVQYSTPRKFDGGGSKFQNKDTIFARITPCTENGKTAYIDFLKDNEVGHGSTEFIILGPKENVAAKFIYYCAKWDKVRSIAISRMEGTSGRQRVPSKVFSEDVFIGIPPFPEQKRIAEILTTVDDTIEETDRIIEKTRELKKGLMQKLLTRGVGHKKFKKTVIGNIPAEWEVVKLKELANIRYGLGQPPALDDNGIPMVRATNIHEGAISKTSLISVKRDALPLSRNPFLKNGDIIVVRSGAYTGDIGLITKEWEGAVAGYDLVVTPSSRIDSLFLTNYLLSNIIQKGYFASLKERSAQPHLNSLQVEETPIALPPITEQIEIAEVLSSTYSEIKQEKAQKKHLETLKKSLMQVLLTGKVRVKLH